MRSIAEIFRSYAVLNDQGVHIGGCDKESNHHYGAAYQQIFDRTATIQRDTVELVMEVGVADGASLLAWAEIFPHAWIVGMDTHPCARAKESPRIEFHLGNQRSMLDCRRAAGGRLFDVIVEDAYHAIDNTLLTLFWLWPYVRPGGLYIVEEWDNVHACREEIAALFPAAEIVPTTGPSGGDEPLVVFRKRA